MGNGEIQLAVKGYDVELRIETWSRDPRDPDLTAKGVMKRVKAICKRVMHYFWQEHEGRRTYKDASDDIGNEKIAEIYFYLYLDEWKNKQKKVGSMRIKGYVQKTKFNKETSVFTLPSTFYINFYPVVRKHFIKAQQFETEFHRWGMRTFR
jgi:hypothetical protein